MDFYMVLGVERGATAGDIKRAYQRLARRFHPDINPGDREAAAQFRQMLEAYETLIDPDRRRRYDAGQARAGGRRRRRDVRLRRASTSRRSVHAERTHRPSAICSPRCFASARRAADGAPSAAPTSTSDRADASKRRGAAGSGR